MKAVVMAGGYGTRLRPLTVKTPKPMIHIANRPMLEHVILLLKRLCVSPNFSLFPPPCLTAHRLLLRVTLLGAA